MAREHLPDVLLLDIAMPGRGGIIAAGEVAAACPATKIIMLTVSKDEDDLMAALKAGARGYVLGMSVPPVMMARIAQQVREQWFEQGTQANAA